MPAGEAPTSLRAPRSMAGMTRLTATSAVPASRLRALGLRALSTCTAAALLTGCGAISDLIGGESAPAESADADAPAAAPSTPAVDPAGAPDPVEGVSDVDREKAAEIVAAMSDEELTGAVVMAEWSSTASETAQLIEQEHLAGAIVMGYNLPESPTPEDVEEVTSTLADAAGDRGWPTVIGVDEEGGPVARLGAATPEFPPLMAAGAVRDADTVEQATAAQGSGVRELGFTLDFAPVADLTIGADDPTINIRSAGDDPDRVSATVTAALAGYSAAGIASSAKHFPGHGSLTVDSHEELPVSEKSLEELIDSEGAPFRAAAEAGATSVLIAHIGLPGSERTPSSLNPDVYTALREDIGFDGVAVTDALNMGAITAGPGVETLDAIRAGADLALMPQDPRAAVTALRTGLANGDLPRDRLTEAAERVVAMQLWQERAAAVAAEPDDPAEAYRALAEQSLTVLSGECTFAEPPESVALFGGSEEARAAFAEAAEEAGLETGSGMRVTLGQTDGSAKVLVGTGGPWKLAPSAGGDQTVLAVYDDNPDAMAAVVDYLTGDLEATGELPVDVGVDAPSCG